jgi:hypothetical protein
MSADRFAFQWCADKLSWHSEVFWTASCTICAYAFFLRGTVCLQQLILHRWVFVSLVVTWALRWIQVGPGTVRRCGIMRC